MKNIKTFGAYYNLNDKSNSIREGYDFSDELESSDDDFNRVCELLDEHLIDYDYNDFSRFYNLKKPDFDQVVDYLLKSGVEFEDELEIEELSNDLEKLMKEFK